MNVFDLPKKIFITGTDTDVGKSVVSAILVQALHAYYWKPVQSGLAENTDTQTVKHLTNLPDPYFLSETYRLHAPLSPHASAKLENIDIRMDAFHIPKYSEEHHLIVEGAGGICVPLNHTYLVVDLIQYLSLPVIIVARSTLGTINHTLLSIHYLKQKGIPILGVVLNGPKNPSNAEAICFYGKVPILFEIEPLPKINPNTLTEFIKHEKYFHR